MSTAAADKPALRKPVFTNVDQLRPGTNGHTLTVKVVSATPVPGRARPGAPAPASSRAPPRIAECLVGDDTGAIVFTARNEQVDLLKPDATVILRNARIDMFKGSMRLAVDKWGRIEATEPASFTVKEDNNLSLVEYELVNVAGAVTVGRPPAWVDVSEEISANMQQAKMKMGELAKAHAKALMPSFGDGRDDQRAMEVLTHEITDLLKRSEKRLQKLSMNDSSEDSNVRKNVQSSLATDLQNLSMEFCKKQSTYLKQLRQQKEDGVDWEMSTNGTKSTFEDDEFEDVGFTEVQKSKLKKSEAFTSERIEHVVESVNELAQIMKDLSFLAIDQGTIIDQNVAASFEEGYKQLQKTFSSEEIENILSQWTTDPYYTLPENVHAVDLYRENSFDALKKYSEDGVAYFVLQLTRKKDGKVNRQMENGRDRWIFSTSCPEGVLVKRTYKYGEKCGKDLKYDEDRCMREFTIKDGVKDMVFCIVSSDDWCQQSALPQDQPSQDDPTSSHDSSASASDKEVEKSRTELELVYERNMLVEEVVNLRSENEQLKNDQSFKTEIEGLKQKLALRDAQLKENNELFQLKEELEKYKHEAQANKNYMVQYKEIAHSNEVALKQLESAHQDYKTEVGRKACEGLVAKLRDKLLEMEKSYVMKCEEAANAIESKEKHITSLMNEISILRTEVSQKQAQLEKLEIELASSKSLLAEQYKHRQTAQDNYERQVILQSETIQELTNTSKQLSSLQHEITVLRQTADALNTENDGLRSSGDQEKIGLLKEKDDAVQKYNELNDQKVYTEHELERFLLDYGAGVDCPIPKLGLYRLDLDELDEIRPRHGNILYSLEDLERNSKGDVIRTFDKRGQKKGWRQKKSSDDKGQKKKKRFDDKNPVLKKSYYSYYIEGKVVTGSKMNEFSIKDSKDNRVLWEIIYPEREGENKSVNIEEGEHKESAMITKVVLEPPWTTQKENEDCYLDELEKLRGATGSESSQQEAIRANEELRKEVESLRVELKRQRDDNEGIPVTAEVAVPVGGQGSNTTDRARTGEASLSGIPNTVPLNLFPQGGSNAGGSAGGGPLEFLRNNQQFQAFREMVHTNPEILQPILQELSKKNPQILRLIQENHSEFLQLLSEPFEGGEGDFLEQPEQDEMPHVIFVTPEEQEAIGRLESMGFERARVIEAFFACDRNEELAANYLLEHTGEED